MIPTKEQLESADWWDLVVPNFHYYMKHKITGKGFFLRQISVKMTKEYSIIAVKPPVPTPSKVDEKPLRNKYDTAVGDVYDVLVAFKVTNPALQHLIKKALKVGKRGHKNIEADLQDIIDSAIRAKEIEGFGSFGQ